VKRLFQKIEGAMPHSLDGHRYIAMPQRGTHDAMRNNPDSLQTRCATNTLDIPASESRMSKSRIPKLQRPKSQAAPQTTGTVVETPSEQPPEQSAVFMESGQRHAQVAERAYYLAQQRDFEPGHELDDWLAAERED
jgi:Protein of unknown function (DUF2934)